MTCIYQNTFNLIPLNYQIKKNPYFVFGSYLVKFWVAFYIENIRSNNNNETCYSVLSTFASYLVNQVKNVSSADNHNSFNTGRWVKCLEKLTSSIHKLGHINQYLEMCYSWLETHLQKVANGANAIPGYFSDCAEIC